MPATETQTFTAPDGTEMVIVTRARYDQLLAIEEDFEDLEAVTEGRASLAAEGGIPADVERAIAGGTHPIIAWRKHRSLTQSDLAEATGLTQAAISRLEKTEPGAGKPDTLRAIAEALDAPLWTLNEARTAPAAAIPMAEDEHVLVTTGKITPKNLTFVGGGNHFQIKAATHSTTSAKTLRSSKTGEFLTPGSKKRDLKKDAS